MLSRYTLAGLAWLCFLVGPGLPPLFGQTNTIRLTPSANRFLLVMETSRSMKPLADGAFSAVSASLSSQMQGQLRPGDTLGIWTFNSELNTGLFPLQWWPARGQENVAGSVLEFLHGQKFQKRANLEKVISTMTGLVRDSDLITILLVTSGDQDIHGTPFDDRINGTFKASRNQQQKARMPFVTVLRGRKGMLTDYAVNSAQWPVEMPPMPPEAQVAKVVAKEKKPAAKPPIATGPPLIFHGKKRDVAPTEAAAPAPQVASTNAAPLVIAKSPLASAQSSPTTPVPAPEPKSEPAKAVAPPPPPAPAALLQVSNAPAILNPASAAVASTPKPAQALSPEPTPAPITARVAPSEAKTPTTTALPASSPVIAAPLAAAPAAAAQSALALPSKDARRFEPLWTVAAVALGAGLAAAFFWMRRPRSGSPVSLISRSLEREIK